ncbi:hypothetical protein C1H46_002847 [Malus baccata]|uniref:Uncharacterized protein n=1 Tax=Malus baccata TaxID=106549 RepID=A0A540NKA3_MALBA|nr:hypothetical protein C1H46_002847 [Malus baccata]
MTVVRVMRRLRAVHVRVVWNGIFQGACGNWSKPEILQTQSRPYRKPYRPPPSSRTFRARPQRLNFSLRGTASWIMEDEFVQAIDALAGFSAGMKACVSISHSASATASIN